MSLTKKLEDAWVRVFGNRVTLVGGIVGAVSFGTFCYGFYEPDLTTDLEQHINLLISEFGFGTVAVTFCGSSTYKHYKRGLKHFQETGDLNKEYFREVIEDKSENTRLFGYCQVQGAYLAAIKVGKVKEFRKAKKEYSKNIIPNF
jgi:hypothetical protein